MCRQSKRWNHNIHYHAVVLRALRGPRERALDIGCGEGILARKLSQRVRHVVALDADAPSIELARQGDPAPEIEYLLGDFVTYPFAPGSFDFVACVAALHHMDEPEALRRMRELLRPGGTLAAVGLARSRSLVDLTLDVAATVVTRVLRVADTYWESPAPTVWPPPHTYREIARIVQDTLPQARFRRHLLWRYSIVWTKPAAAGEGQPNTRASRVNGYDAQ